MRCVEDEGLKTLILSLCRLFIRPHKESLKLLSAFHQHFVKSGQESERYAIFHCRLLKRLSMLLAIWDRPERSNYEQSPSLPPVTFAVMPEKIQPS